MQHTGQQEGLSRFAPAAVFILSLLYLAVLLSTIHTGVFFSGDGGLKYLTLQQHTGTSGFTTLRVQSPPWMSTIWEKGYYPFKEPFVYDRAGEKILSFPPFFQQLSSNPYRLFGYEGIYLLPALSLVLLWGWFTWLLYKLKFPRYIIALALFVLTACSPLTFYAATFWEHTLAALLYFSGILFLVKPVGKPLPALVLGVLTALSSWLRPEALLLCAGLVAVLLYDSTTRKRPAVQFFLGGMTGTIFLFFLFNYQVYGNLLGAHSYQIETGGEASQRIVESAGFLLHLNLRQIQFFPMSLLSLASIIICLLQKRALPRVVLQLSFISLAFMMIAPFFLPNAGGRQWGARYFLLLIPLVLVAGVTLLRSFKTFDFFHRTWRWILLPLVIYSAILNLYGGWKTLRDDYRDRVRPALAYLQQDNCKTIIVQNQYVAQEFAALFASKHIFRAETRQQLLALQHLLKTASVQDAVFLVREKEGLLKCIPSATMEGNTVHLGDYYLSRCSW